MEDNKNVLAAREKHIAALNAIIDAIINLEDFTPIPVELSNALSKVNSMRNQAEEDIEPGDKIWDSFNKEFGIVQSVGILNYFFENGKLSVGKKYCFKIAI